MQCLEVTGLAPPRGCRAGATRPNQALWRFVQRPLSALTRRSGGSRDGLSSRRVCGYLSHSCRPLSDYYNYNWRERPVCNVSVGAGAESAHCNFGCGARGGAIKSRRRRWRAGLDPVDEWPMARPLQSNSGASPSRYPLLASTCGRYPPLAGCMLHGGKARKGRSIRGADRPVRNLVGAIGWWWGA